MLTYQFVIREEAFELVARAKSFRCLVLVERDVDRETMLAICRGIVDAGCRYSMVWGPNCEAWHDAFDDVGRERWGAADAPPEKHVMTTWHDGESLSDALFFAKRVATCTSDGREMADLIVVDLGAAARQAEIGALYENV